MEFMYSPKGTPGFNWNPVVQGLITGFASALGMSVSPSSVAPSVGPTASPSVDKPALEARINDLETKFDKLYSDLSTLTTSVNSLVQASKSSPPEVPFSLYFRP
jgi:hypothetical protein